MADYQSAEIRAPGSEHEEISHTTQHPHSDNQPGTFQLDYEDGQPVVKHTMPQSVEIGADGSRYSDADFIKSAVNRTGTPVAPSEIGPETLVTLAGMQGDLLGFERMGLVERKPDGTYVLGTYFAAEQALERQAQEQEEADAPLEGTGNAEAETFINTLAAAVSMGDQMQAIHEITSGGKLSVATAGVIASQLGCDARDVLDRAEILSDAFAVQAVQACAASGGEDVIEWAKTHRSAELRKAMSLQATQRSTKGYRDLGRDYLSNLDTIHPEQILGGRLGPGMRVFKGTNGKIMVSSPEGTMQWKQAVLTGVVAPQFGGGR